MPFSLVIQDAFNPFAKVTTASVYVDNSGNPAPGLWGRPYYGDLTTFINTIDSELVGGLVPQTRQGDRDLPNDGSYFELTCNIACTVYVLEK